MASIKYTVKLDGAMCDSLKVMRLLAAMELIKDEQITVLPCRGTDEQRAEVK